MSISEVIREIFVDCPIVWAVAMEAAAPEAEIDTVNRQAMFIAQCGHESQDYTVFEENLNYRAQRLAEVWPDRFSTEPRLTNKMPNQLALSLHKRPQAIANTIYANREGNGPPSSHDGWTFRGRGPIQITFRNNYQACGEWMGIDLIGNPDLLLQPEYGARAAAWFWMHRNINPLCDIPDVAAVTRRINGGYNGLIHRQQLFNRARHAFAG